MMSTGFFPFDLDRRYLPVWGLLGVRSGDGVTVSDEELMVTYGRFRLSCPMDNVVEGHITGPYRWYTSVGVRLSLADDGLTLGTNRHQGVCLHFADRVGGVVPGRKHSALTVTVADCRGLVDAVGPAPAG